jgi:hypothetical protein
MVLRLGPADIGLQPHPPDALSDIDSHDGPSARYNMAHVLSFDVRRRDEDDVTVITPRVDGVMLTTLAERFERSHGLTDPAGGYGGLIPEYFRYGPLDRYFLGKSDTPYFANTPGRIYVLGCECGEVGCWPLSCVIDASGSAITWQSFEQPHRPERAYSSFGPFVFDREQYEEALCSLPKQ